MLTNSFLVSLLNLVPKDIQDDKRRRYLKVAELQKLSERSPMDDRNRPPIGISYVPFEPAQGTH